MNFIRKIKFLEISTIVAGLCFLAVARAAVTVPATVIRHHAIGAPESPPSAPAQLLSTAPQTSASQTAARSFGLAAKVSFTLRAIKVEGATVFKPRDFKRTYAAYIGKRVKAKDLKKIINAMTEMYWRKGYVLAKASLPAQSVKHGVLRVDMHEGKILGVTLSGIKHPFDKLRAYARRLVAEKPPNMKQMEHTLLLMNDLPGVKLQSYISPAAHDPFLSTLALKGRYVADGGFVQLDNRGSQYLGPWQVTGDMWFNSLFDHYSHTEAQVRFTPDTSQMRLFNISNMTPVGTHGLTIGFNALYAKDVPGYTLSSLDINGTDKTFGGTLRYPLIRSRARNWFVEAAFTATNVTTYSLGSLLNHDKLRVVRLGTEYSFSDRFRGLDEISFSASKGLKGFGASAKGDANLSRQNGNPQFFKLDLSLMHLQRINRRWSFLLAAKGQYTPDTLLVPEEFSYGGSDFGRAYDDSEMTGNDGAAAKMEVRWTPAWLHSRFVKTGSYIYTFADTGAVWGLTTASPRESGSSVGLGTALWLRRSDIVDMQIAQPIGRAVATQSNGRNVPRIFIKLVHSF